MGDDERQIRALIEQWAAAVHEGDLAGVLASHSEDIVMFDVPPPHDGVRGIDAYREAWPDFFAWQASGAMFEIESLDVTVGGDVAFAHALLLCDTPAGLRERPDSRLRLTFGLRKEDGRWVVAHEHHSFPHASGADGGTAEHELRDLHERWFEATAAKDLDALMASIDEHVVSYEHEAPLQLTTLAGVREACARGLEAGGESVEWTVPDLRILVRDDLAVTWGLNRVRGDGPDGTAFEMWSRGTRVFRKRDGRWTMVHQHLSVPLDPETGAAKLDLRP